MSSTEKFAESRRHLDRVIGYHRDRGVSPMDFCFAYILRKSDCAPMQSDYDEAVEAFVVQVASMSGDECRVLEASIDRSKSESYVSTPAQEVLGRIGGSKRLAHCWAVAYIRATYFDLEPYLKSEVPVASRVLVRYPELRRLLTPDDGLLPVGGGVRLGDAWMTYKQHEIQAHPYLQSHCDLFALAAQLRRQHAAGLVASLGIDHFRLCPLGQLAKIFRRDAWFGARFSMGEIDDRTAVGVTVHSRTRDLSPSDKAGLRTEFRWTLKKEGIKQLEIEELEVPLSGDVHSDRPVVCRYVHSMRDMVTSRFVHLDGAITVYSRAAYERRYEQASNHRQPKVWADEKVKLFRVDAPEHSGPKKIAKDDWMKIVVSFFQNNEHILEYFDGRSFGEIYRSQYGHDYPYWGK